MQQVHDRVIVVGSSLSHALPIAKTLATPTSYISILLPRKGVKFAPEDPSQAIATATRRGRNRASDIANNHYSSSLLLNLVDQNTHIDYSILDKDPYTIPDCSIIKPSSCVWVQDDSRFPATSFSREDQP